MLFLEIFLHKWLFNIILFFTPLTKMQTQYQHTCHLSSVTTGKCIWFFFPMDDLVWSNKELAPNKENCQMISKSVKFTTTNWFRSQTNSLIMCYNFLSDSKDSQATSCIDYHLRKKFTLGLNLGHDNLNLKCSGDNKIDVFFYSLQIKPWIYW